MNASSDGPFIVAVGAASGTGRPMALAVVASSADALSLADVDTPGLKRISERLSRESRAKSPVEVSSDRSAAARTGEAECAPSGGLFPRSSWLCRYWHHDVEAGRLVSRKSSCEAVTTLKGLKAERDGMPNFATCNSVGMGVPVTGECRDGSGAAIARAFQDVGANVIITGVEIVPVAHAAVTLRGEMAE